MFSAFAQQIDSPVVVSENVLHAGAGIASDKGTQRVTTDDTLMDGIRFAPADVNAVIKRAILLSLWGVVVRQKQPEIIRDRQKPRPWYPC